MKDLSISHVPTPISPRTLTTTAFPAQGGNFLTYLKHAVGEVDALQQNVGQEVKKLIAEGKGDLQETIIAMERADVSFRLMMQIRNKVLDAYQEIIRMQV
jgi:flagellar hook-basal body complex protein FliE